MRKFNLVYIDKGEYSKIDYDLQNRQLLHVGALEVKGCPDKKIDDELTVKVAMRKLIDLQQYQKQQNPFSSKDL